MLALVKREAPCCLTAVLVKPQLVTPTTMLWDAAEPKLVPARAGARPKFTIHGPPLEPPVCSEPMIVLFEKLAAVKPCESVCSISAPRSRATG